MARRKKKGSALAQEVFESHLGQLKRHVENNGVKGLRKLYRDTQADLRKRLLAAGGEGSTTATATQLKAMIAQTEAALAILQRKLKKHLEDVSKTATTLGARHAVDEFLQLEAMFTGTTPVLGLERAAIFRGLTGDTHSSLLSRHQRSSAAWSLNVINEIEKALAVGAMAQKPIDQMVPDVMKALGDAPRWRAERIVRTELAHAHGAAKHAAMTRTAKDLGETELKKRLIETFDDRTGDDSFLVHGQTVPVEKPFTWKHKVRGRWVVTPYMHPPNRPNDRAVVIPWRDEWDETAMAHEKPLTRAQLRSARTTKWRSTPGVTIPPGHKPGKSYRK